MSARLFVGNLACEVTEAELRGLFSEAGTPVSVRVLTDREAGKPRGFAFVEFADPCGLPPRTTSEMIRGSMSRP